MEVVVNHRGEYKRYVDRQHDGYTAQYFMYDEDGRLRPRYIGYWYGVRIVDTTNWWDLMKQMSKHKRTNHG